MRAMRLSATGSIETAPLRLEDVPTPEPGDEEVRLRVRCCAICRTDLHVIEGDLPEAQRPITPGHQIVGVVDRVGHGCRRLRAGMRVGVAWLRQTCGACPFCRAGRENLCDEPRFTGCHEDGGFAEYAVAPEAFAYALPDAFDDVAASPLLCAGIIGYRALRRAELRAGERLGLVGFGSSAHVVLQIARHRGHEVYVVSRGEDHLAQARRLGAAWAGRDAGDMPARPEAIVVFAPVGDVVPPALARLNKGGRLVLAGIHMTPVPTLDYRRHLFDEREIRSVTANTRDDARALLAEAGGANVQPETTVYPLERANEALGDLKAGRISGTGVLVVE